MPRIGRSFWIRFIVVLAIALAGWALWPRARAVVRRSLKAAVAEVLRDQTRDLNFIASRRAGEDAADFVAKEMGQAKACKNKFTLFDAALQRVDPRLKGMYCEFGVWKGTTINYIAAKTPELVHGFDSFEGLPEDWRPGFNAGTFKMQALPQVLPNVRLYKGWFKDSLPVFKKDHPEPLAFGHLDADLYSSTKDVFDALGDRIVAGTVLQFDEFFNYPGWREGESKAFFEFCQARKAEVEYIGYVPDNEQVAVQIKKIAPPPASAAKR
jgi:hypothetical protein